MNLVELLHRKSFVESCIYTSENYDIPELEKQISEINDYHTQRIIENNIEVLYKSPSLKLTNPNTLVFIERTKNYGYTLSVPDNNGNILVGNQDDISKSKLYHRHDLEWIDVSKVNRFKKLNGKLERERQSLEKEKEQLCLLEKELERFSDVLLKASQYKHEFPEMNYPPGMFGGDFDEYNFDDELGILHTGTMVFVCPNDETVNIGRITKWEMTKKGNVKWVIKYVDNGIVEKIRDTSNMCSIPFKYLHPETSRDSYILASNLRNK